jgi:hypothetical protein
MEEAMATTWISFGPDLEPLESESRRGAQTPPVRRDGISVTGRAEEVANKLIEASGTSAAWCRFEQQVENGGARPVYVNGATVRFVIEDT